MNYKLKDNKIEEFVEDNIEWFRNIIKEGGDLEEKVYTRLRTNPKVFNDLFKSVEEIEIKIKMDSSLSFETKMVSRIIARKFWSLERNELNNALDINVYHLENWKEVYKEWLKSNTEKPWWGEVPRKNWENVSKNWNEFVKTLTRNTQINPKDNIRKWIMESDAMVYDNKYGVMVTWNLEYGFKAFSPYDNQVFFEWENNWVVDVDGAYKSMRNELEKEEPSYIRGYKIENNS